MEQKEELLFSILRSTDIIHEFIKAIIWMVVDFLQNYLGAKKYNMNLSNICLLYTSDAADDYLTV